VPLISLLAMRRTNLAVHHNRYARSYNITTWETLGTYVPSPTAARVPKPAGMSPTR
jgi:hypothetical protein